MKKFVFLLFMASCSDSDPKRDIYNSLEGAWFFADKQVSGEIWISESNGIQSIDRKGYFSFETFSYVVNDASEIKYKPAGKELIDYLYLLSSNGIYINELYLLDGIINETFTEITFDSFVLIRDQSQLDNFDRQIIMKRR